MQLLVLRARLLSFVGLKTLNFLSFLYRGLKFVIKNPFKVFFAILKIWFALMFFTFFSFMVIAQEDLPAGYDLLDLDNLVLTEMKPFYKCSYNASSGSRVFFNTESTDDCVEQAAAHEVSNTYYCKYESSFDMQRTATYLKKKVYFYSYVSGECRKKNESAVSVSLVDDGTPFESCPPELHPMHDTMIVWPVGSTQKMCAKKLLGNPPNQDPEQKSCDDLVGNDSSFYGSTVNKNSHPDSSNINCLENGSKFCETTANVFLETDMGENFVRYSPVGGSTFTGAECTDATNTAPPPDSEEQEDKYCSVSNSDGVYLVECPENTIAMNWNTVLALAETSNLDNQRIAAIEATFLTKTEINALVAQVEEGQKGEKGEKGDTGSAGAKGSNGLDGKDGKDGEDGEDGEDCSIVQTSVGASITCGASTATVKSGESCSTVQLSNGDSQIKCEDGTTSTLQGIDEDGIVSVLNTQLTEMQKQTALLEKGTTYDGDKPVIDYTTKPDTYTEIQNFDWDENNFGTVMESHIDQMKNLPLFSAIDGFFDTSFGGSCPVWETNVSVMQATFNIKIDQFCSSSVQSILPLIRAILMLVAGFFAWRIAIE